MHTVLWQVSAPELIHEFFCHAIFRKHFCLAGLPSNWQLWFCPHFHDAFWGIAGEKRYHFTYRLSTLNYLIFLFGLFWHIGLKSLQQWKKGFLFLYILASIHVIILVIWSVVRWNLKDDLLCFTLITTNVKHFLLHFLCICISSLVTLYSILTPHTIFRNNKYYFTPMASYTVVWA